jgi:DNA invertase Pin-like site-specific DNA recombinase
MNKKKTPPRVAVYIRVANASQLSDAEDVQREKMEKMKAFCEKHGWTPQEIYADIGFSGLNMERPSLLRLLHDFKKGKFDLCVIPSESNLARDYFDMMRIQDKAEKAGVEIVPADGASVKNDSLLRMAAEIAKSIKE